MLVRKLRLERAWSQETLAEISGLSVRTIQRVEHGAVPSLDTRAALAAAFDVDAAIFSGESNMAHASSSTEITEAEHEALEHVRDLKGFYLHAAAYSFVNVTVFAVWLMSSSSYPWFLWPAFGWGVGLASHGLSVFEIFSLFSPEWERRQVAKRLGRQPSRPAR